MAGKVSLNTRLHASSLLEVVIAMMLLLIVFGIAVTIYANVTGAATTQKKETAINVLNLIDKSNILAEKSIRIDTAGFTIEREIRILQQDHIKIVTLRAYQSKVLVAEKKHLLHL